MVAILASTRGAQADVDPTASFDWEAPEGCPSERSVRDSIRTLVRSSAMPVRARAVATGGPPWTARIRIEQGDERGDRTLEASSCEALAQAVALVVALAIDRAEAAPVDGTPPAAPAPKSPPDDSRTPVPPLSTTSPMTSADVDRRTLEPEQRFATHAGLAARSGLLPSVVPGLEAGMALTEGGLELSARAGVFARSSSDAQPTDAGASRNATGSFLLATLEARAAWVLRATSVVRVAPFGGVGLAWLRGEGRGADVDQAASDWLPMPLAGVEARARIGHGIEPYLGIDAGLPLGRSSFRFRGASEPAFEPAVVTARASAGVRLFLF